MVEITFGGQHAALVVSTDSVPTIGIPSPALGQVHSRDDGEDGDGGRKKRTRM